MEITSWEAFLVEYPGFADTDGIDNLADLVRYLDARKTINSVGIPQYVLREFGAVADEYAFLFQMGGGRVFIVEATPGKQEGLLYTLVDAEFVIAILEPKLQKLLIPFVIRMEIAKFLHVLKGGSLDKVIFHIPIVGSQEQLDKGEPLMTIMVSTEKPDASGMN